MLSLVLGLCKVRAGVNNIHKTGVDQRGPQRVQLIVLYFCIPFMGTYKTTLFQKRCKSVSRQVGIEMKLGCLVDRMESKARAEGS